MQIRGTCTSIKYRELAFNSTCSSTSISLHVSVILCPSFQIPSPRAHASTHVPNLHPGPCLTSSPSMITCHAHFPVSHPTHTHGHPWPQDIYVCRVCINPSHVYMQKISHIFCVQLSLEYYMLWTSPSDRLPPIRDSSRTRPQRLIVGGIIFSWRLMVILVGKRTGSSYTFEDQLEGFNWQFPLGDCIVQG